MFFLDVQNQANGLLEAGYNELCRSEDVSVFYDFSKESGVYVFIDDEKIIYVGECVSFSKRLKQYINNTTACALRRSIGHHRFGQKKNPKKKHSDDVERSITEVISKLKIKFLPVVFGRKELEEYILKREKPVYNIRGNC